ncbi:hypothetical protein [Sansalvadorimonas verongulae]|uniref:hypothetical protein n=1 Tax=Sansalvadorimonas verongulae TaxID=2172824 RepID=UPI0012BCB8E2|nr:hypothetical protein [Sansalvadorimonas verongulae]MTI13614.1 hypothetical protein [Sansalvadorimonas verongulae]
MTTEVVVMNKSAVAMAADSAVTISGGSQSTPKIYNSVNKLFQLSKYSSVGIMVYGGAEMMGVPWETIIKMYRQKLGSRQFERLEEYANDFFDFLQNDSSLFSGEMCSMFLRDHILAILEKLFHPLEDILKEASQSGADISETPSKLVRVLGSSLAQAILSLKNAPLIDRADGHFCGQLVQAVRTFLEDHFENLTKGFPLEEFSQDLYEKFSAQIIEVIVKAFVVRQAYTQQISGLVIAGFGEKDLFPATLSYTVEGVYKRVKYWRDEHLSGSIDVTIQPP